MGSNADPWQQTSRSEATLDLEKFRDWFRSRKDQKGLMKGEDLRVLEETTQLSHKRSWVLEATLTISLKKITSEIKFAERNSALLPSTTWMNHAISRVPERARVQVSSERIKVGRWNESIRAKRCDAVDWDSA